jgi:hypothetical protein
MPLPFVAIRFSFRWDVMWVVIRFHILARVERKCNGLATLLVVHRTLQDGGKRDMRQGPEELMRRQATASEFGRSQAAEEASEGTRVNERIGLLAAQESGLVPDSVVNGDRRAGQ